MKAMHNLLLLTFLFNIPICNAAEFFNLTFMVPNMNKTQNSQSIYISVKLPMDDELYIVDFHPIYDRQKIRFITTYLCTKPYLAKEQFWFDNQPCLIMERSMIIYEWYYNVPAVKWPEEAGFRVGQNTIYPYVVVSIKYFQAAINDSYGQTITMLRGKPKYEIGAYSIFTNAMELKSYHAEFSCRYHSVSIQVFAAQFYSKYKGRSVSLYRIRDSEVQSILKGNLNWPQTFYQLPNTFDFNKDDYLIGACVYGQKPEKYVPHTPREIVCLITIMFNMSSNDEMPIEMCVNNDYPGILHRYQPNDTETVPQTLFDINPIYPNVTLDQWVVMVENQSKIVAPIKNMNDTNVLLLTYAAENRYREAIRLMRNHHLLLICLISISACCLGLLTIIAVVRLARSCRDKVVSIRNNNRAKSISLGGKTSSVSRWLTKRRFQHYDQDQSHSLEGAPLTSKHRWASSSEESDMSENEIYNAADFRNVALKN